MDINFKIRNLTRYLGAGLASPFRRNAGWMLLYTLSGAIYFLFTDIRFAETPSIRYHLAYSFLCAYILLVPAGFMRGVWRGIWLGVIGALYLVNLLFDLTLNTILFRQFNFNLWVYIFGTNTGEASEFVTRHFGLTEVMHMAVALVVFGTGAVFLPRLLRNRLRWTAVIGLLGVAVATMHVFRQPRFIPDCIGGKLYMLAYYRPAPDLSRHRVHAALTRTGTPPPHDIVLIIGESFSRAHSSLYGYGRDTSPRLRALADDSMLYVFTDVEAPQVHTVEVFRELMTTYRSDTDGPDHEAWYDRPKIVEVMKDAGYRTHWLSNQARQGMFDNLPSSFSQLCDVAVFHGEQFEGSAKSDKDGALVPRLDSLVTASGAHPGFYVVHLMGSHPTFTSRFPDEYSVFGPKEYDPRTPWLEYLLNQYDNSILYNDAVVCGIMRRMADRDAVVIYLSDHGIDAAVSDAGICDQAVDSNPRSVAAAKPIPMMIFVSPSYRRRNPLLVKRILASLDRQYNSADLIYTLMDIAGVTFAADTASHRRSLLYRP